MLGIADNVLIVGYDNNVADHNRSLCKALQFI